MNTHHHLALLLASTLLIGSAAAQDPEPSEMTLTSFSLTSGGEASADELTVTLSIGGPVEPQNATSADGEMAMIPGSMGQIVRTTSATLVQTTLPESGSTLLQPTFTLDDGTLVAGWESVTDFLVLSGPVTGIDNGLAQTSAVYQDTPAQLQLRSGGVAFDFHLTTLNVSNDDFGPYAADGVHDLWQVQNFGESNPDGAGTADPDGDGQQNLVEWAFGLNPALGDSGVITILQDQIVKRGTPFISIQNIPNGTDFHALFGRRKDHVTSGLTYIVQFSADLVTWQDSTATPDFVADDGDYEAVSVRYPALISGKVARFFRVALSTP